MELVWDGLINARDLGGVPLRDGRTSRSGAYARSDHPSLLTTAGWQQFNEYGVQTIASLETGGLEGEEALRANRPVHLPEGVTATVIRLAVEDGRDDDFMERWARTGLWGTPLYFADALERWPLMYGEALNAIAGAKPPVLIHCGRGWDRTGIMALLLLTIAGATTDGVVEDYLLSTSSPQARESGSLASFQRAMSDSGTSVRAAIGSAAEVVNEDWLLRARVGSASIDTIRAQLAG